MGWRAAILDWLTRDLRRRFAAAFADPAAAQAARLQEILRGAAGSAYGRAHGLDEGCALAEYRSRVPLVGWEQLDPWVARIAAGEAAVLTREPVGLFLRTSGSTGPAKLVPCTPGLERETGDARAWWVVQMIGECERAAAGQHLTIYSPEVEGVTPGGIPYGSNTGRIRNRQPKLVRLNDPVPEAVFSLKDAQARYDLILRFALASANLATFSTANPSTALLLVERLQQRAEPLLDELARGVVGPRSALPEELRAQLQATVRPLPRRAAALRRLLAAHGELRPPEVWPKLATLNTWRCGGADFYEPALRRWFAPVPLRDPGFSASEGFVAIPFTHRDPAGVLNVAGHFFEFLPAEAPPAGSGAALPPTLLAHELAPGMLVRPVLTTAGGLYRYDLGDVARVEGRFAATPTLRFLHRAGRVLSVTGEKVTEAHASQAARAAAEQAGWSLVEFTVGLQLRDPPRYCLLAEPAGPPARVGPRTSEAELAAAFDAALGAANVEYRAKRDSLRLGPPRLLLAPAGAFARWRGALVAGGAPDGQVKIPHLVKDFGVIEALAAGNVPRGAAG